MNDPGRTPDLFAGRWGGTLSKTKWVAGKIGKHLQQRAFGVAALLVGGAVGYLGLKLLWIVS